MINYRLADLRTLLACLREEGCAVIDMVDESKYGTFGWVLDPEGNRIERWQPPEGRQGTGLHRVVAPPAEPVELPDGTAVTQKTPRQEVHA